jgi:hypothetical protein
MEPSSRYHDGHIGAFHSGKGTSVGHDPLDVGEVMRRVAIRQVFGRK